MLSSTNPPAPPPVSRPRRRGITATRSCVVDRGRIRTARGGCGPPRMSGRTSRTCNRARRGAGFVHRYVTSPVWPTDSAGSGSRVTATLWASVASSQINTTNARSASSITSKLHGAQNPATPASASRPAISRARGVHRIPAVLPSTYHRPTNAAMTALGSSKGCSIRRSAPRCDPESLSAPDLR